MNRRTSGSMNTMISSIGTRRSGSGTRLRSTQSGRGTEVRGCGATLSSSATIFRLGQRERSPSTSITCAFVSAWVRASMTPLSVYPLHHMWEQDINKREVSEYLTVTCKSPELWTCLMTAPACSARSMHTDNSSPIFTVVMVVAVVVYFVRRLREECC